MGKDLSDEQRRKNAEDMMQKFISVMGLDEEYDDEEVPSDEDAAKDALVS